MSEKVGLDDTLTLTPFELKTNNKASLRAGSVVRRLGRSLGLLDQNVTAKLRAEVDADIKLHSCKYLARGTP